MRSHTVLLQSDHAFVATAAAERKRQQAPSSGERLSMEEAAY